MSYGVYEGGVYELRVYELRVKRLYVGQTVFYIAFFTHNYLIINP